MLPNFSFEKKLWKRGYKSIAGVDEVGRGCFAGPVVAGAVALTAKQTKAYANIRINDSKKLTPKQRERAYYWIRRTAKFYGIGKASVVEINKLGIKKATEIAFRKAIKNCKKRPDYLLIDAFYVPYVRGLRRKNQLPIVHGDSRSVSIAAASIIGKVYRDRLMTNLGNKPKYRKYGWQKNKGYGTKEHQKAIKKYNLTRHHRKQFVETWLRKINT